MFSFLKKQPFTSMVTTSCAVAAVALAISVTPSQIDEAQALSLSYHGGTYHKHHKYRHHRHHRRYHRGYRSRFHVGFHGGYYRPRYYGPRYYGGGYPVVHPVPVAPPVICPIPVAPAPVYTAPAYYYGGRAVGPVYRVFVPGGC